MTNNQAIELLKAFRPCVAPTLSEAMSIAINALTAQPEKTQLSEEDATSDCISRQAAIEALKEAFNPSITNFVKAKIAIDNLPSAQPEIVRCKECVYADENYHCDYMTTWNYGDCFCSYGKRKKENRWPNM